jgi:hypothetical protein
MSFCSGTVDERSDVMMQRSNEVMRKDGREKI